MLDEVQRDPFPDQITKFRIPDPANYNPWQDFIDGLGGNYFTETPDRRFAIQYYVDKPARAVIITLFDPPADS
jgi:hypothetical protein